MGGAGRRETTSFAGLQRDLQLTFWKALCGLRVDVEELYGMHIPCFCFASAGLCFRSLHRYQKNKYIPVKKSGILSSLIENDKYHDGSLLSLLKTSGDNILPHLLGLIIDSHSALSRYFRADR